MKVHCGYCEALIEAGAACPECGTLDDTRNAVPRELSRTMREMRSLVPRSQTEPEQAFPVTGPVIDATPVADTQRFRPVRRPPTPLLKVLDDDGSTGEVIRLRAEKFEIGREQGDLQLRHDNAVSARHASLQRCFENGRYFWRLDDLKSANGVFIRVNGEHPLPGENCFQIGERIFQIDHAASAKTQMMERPHVTRRIGGIRRNGHSGDVELVEIDPSGEGARQLLDGDRFVIGCSLDCDVVLLEDETVSPHHAELVRKEDGEWVLRDLDSVNGVWIRTSSYKLYRPTEFQLGEQRFIWDLVQS